MIELKEVTVSFDGQVVLDQLNLSVRDGEFIYLVGTTGAGKSSLLRLLYMDLKPD
jgi:ABC-type sugar transport system ATPase subunit